jgi:V/A-type H+-transporting ATPase subunit K
MADAVMTLEMVQASQVGMKAIGAGLAVGLTGVGTGVAEMGIGAAAVGAIAENKDFFGLVVGLLLLF